MKKVVLIIVFASSFFTLEAAAKSETLYTITDLGTLGGEVLAYDLNNTGQVTGQLRLADNSIRGFAWENGKLEILPPLPNANTSSGVAIDASGLIAGNSELSTDTVGHQTRGVVWQKNGSDGWIITRVLNPNYTGTFGADEWSEVLGLGEAGQALGWSPFAHQGGVVPSATIWLSEAGLPLDFSFCKACHLTQVYDLDPSGVIAVGNRQLPPINTGVMRAEAWKKTNGEWLPLPFTSTTTATVYAINNTHTMAGFVGAPKRAAVWTETSPYVWSEPTLLGSLGPNDRGSVAHDINQAGIIVGSAKTNIGPHAFLYKDGILYDLNTLISPEKRWLLENARAINDLGQIVGWGKHQGKKRSFLLTPLL